MLAPPSHLSYEFEPMIFRVARTLFFLISVFGFFPGGEIVVEQVKELVSHGHFAHTVPGEADPFAAEHGCGPAEQNCSCAHAQPTMTQQRADSAAFPADPWLTWMLDAQRASRPGAAQWFGTNEVPPANRANAPPTPPANA